MKKHSKEMLEAVQPAIRGAIKLLEAFGYTVSKEPQKEQVVVVILRSGVTGLWGWMVYNQKDELLYEEEEDSRNLQKDAMKDAMEWVGTFGYHCPEVEVRS